ncbi:hypothetical protein M3Y99_01807200 [Aphelenchoides fujianensis]|nr:hypothetical protein M3Y99_01807200 [Aphelenchoides fujianensis]
MPPAQSCNSGPSSQGRALAFAGINNLTEPPGLRVVRISRTGVFAFDGIQSIFSPDEEGHPFTIDGREYRSVSDFYRQKMFVEMTDGRLSYERQQDGDWRALLTRNGVSQASFDQWFLHRGLLYLQWAVLQRAIEHKPIRDVLMAVGTRYILYTNKDDRFYGTGQKTCSSLRKWETVQASNAMVPAEFPLTAASLPFLLDLWAGRNVLGTILMTLRHKAIEGVPLASLCPRIPEWPSPPPRDDALEPPVRRHSVRFAPYDSTKRAAGGKLHGAEDGDVDVWEFANPPRAVATPPPPRPKTPTPPKGAGRRRSSPRPLPRCVRWADEVEVREDSVARNVSRLVRVLESLVPGGRLQNRFEREGAPSPPSPRSRL